LHIVARRPVRSKKMKTIFTGNSALRTAEEDLVEAPDDVTERFVFQAEFSVETGVDPCRVRGIVPIVGLSNEVRI
jgi:hypothetical protein